MMEDVDVRIPEGIILNLRSIDESLVDDAQALLEDPSDINRWDLIATTRISLHRLKKAAAEIGLEI